MIIIQCIGKIKKPYVKEGVNVFLKRLKKYAKVEYKEVKGFDNLKGYIIVLDVKGKRVSSEEFAKKLKKLMVHEKDITFVIGGPEGIPKDIIEKSNEQISLSTMTFPNELVRLIFLEQLYRGFTIINNEPYHK